MGKGLSAVVAHSGTGEAGVGDGPTESCNSQYI